MVSRDRSGTGGGVLRPVRRHDRGCRGPGHPRRRRPMRSPRLARRARWRKRRRERDQRYTTEILAGLTAAGVLDHEAGVFTLPPEHALFVSDSSSPYYMGGWFDMLPAGYAVIDRVAEAARHGGGVRFDEFGPEMLRGLDRANGPSQRILLTRKWLPAVEGLVKRLEEGIDVADVGCGTGTAALTMAQAYPNSRF